ncbi:restriction endonuclease subunit S [Campylobacter taeniopygiae]|uniref:restriction endonuclease subunit S n=1 Tax=Campylobacter taeniopygiae TaxID=2510188 RepID=UPI003D6AFFC9
MWKEFKISGIFENYHGKRLIEKQRLKGDIPFLTAGENNNGISSFIGNNILTHENFISVDMFGNSFYHSYRASGDDNIYFFINKNLSKYIKLFIVCCINKQKTKYSYGKQFRQTNADTCKILLPIDSKGNPHWQFMEDYMRAIEKEYLEKITAYYNAKLNENNRGGGFDLDKYKKFIQNQKQLENVEWKEFKINEIFNVYTGGDLILSKIKKGNIPIISHSVLNNGISSWSSQIKYRKIFNYKTTISLADRGNFFAFTQMQNFYIGTRVKALEIKYNVDFDVLKFICVCINKQSERFSYGRNCCANIEFLNIILPIDSKGNPNWQFMEDYIKDIEYKKIKDIVAYYQRKS